MLAVLVAAPCTAPFMAAAIGYALTASAPLALCVFAALGLGLALPFALRQLHARPCSGACRGPAPGWRACARCWPSRCTARPPGSPGCSCSRWAPEGLGLLFAAGVALAFALYLFGGAQRREAAGAGAVLALLGAGLVVTASIFLAALAATGPADGGAAAAATERALAAEPYAPERLAALRAQNRPVFVNFTAAWCVTCKVNERVALSQPEVRQAFRAPTRPIWSATGRGGTRVIARALAEHGRAGVPLYLVYRPGAAEPEVLPQILTPDVVKRALQRR